MFISYLKIALRNLFKYKTYSFINIFGLATGLACCLLILLFIAHELSYDRFHRNADRIYRVTTKETGEQEVTQLATTNTPLAPLLAAEFPEMESIVRLVPHSVSLKAEDGRLFQEDKLLFADSAFFDLFSFNLVRGDPFTALAEPFSLVLTHEAALKYFGSIDVVGRFMTLEAKHAFKVTGVLEMLPPASSIRFTMLASIASAPDVVGPWFFRHWFHPPIYTFVRLGPNARVEELNTRLAGFVRTRLGERFAFRSYSLQPLSSIHLSPEYANGLESASSPVFLYSLSALALLIIVLAGINFTNLATARSMARAKEVGLRKVVGAKRGELLQQFLGESILHAGIALAIALLAVELLLPVFVSLTGKQVDSILLGNPVFILALIGFSLVVGISAGLYPALVLSSFQPLKVLRRVTGTTGSGKRGARLRRALVVVQFTISIALIIFTLVVHSQMTFIQNKDLGFQKEQVVIIPVRDEAIQENYQRVKTSLQALPGVVSVTALSNFPWERGFYGFPIRVDGGGKEFETNASTLLVDEDFLRTLGMEITIGRDFLKNSSVDANEAFMINETAVKKFGFDNPIGMKLTMNSVSSGEPKKGEVVGVVKDFHFQSLYSEIGPLVLTVSPMSYYLDNIVVRLGKGHIPETLHSLEVQWHQVAPNRPFEYFFLDQAFDELYRTETRLAAVFNTFSGLAIFIGCLGLFGLASYTIQQRTKEIGVRKVLGASVPGVVGLLSKEFVWLVAIANVIAWPLAYVGIHRWLENFAYRVEIGWWVFALAGGSALLIALLTVSLQAIKSALTNPVEALRYE